MSDGTDLDGRLGNEDEDRTMTDDTEILTCFVCLAALFLIGTGALW